MHKPYGGHPQRTGQGDASDKTKHIKMYVAISQLDMMVFKSG